jgi:hypothetical protein
MRYLQLFCISSIVLLCWLTSCDKVSMPLKPVVHYANDTAPVRKILLEDYTGHLCNNCPLAAAQADSLMSIYGNRIVMMKVNVSFFAEPCPPHPLPPGAPTGSYKGNYMTTAGTAWDNFFQISSTGLPAGMVDRLPGDAPPSPYTTYGNWPSKVAALVNVPQTANIRITNTYNSTNGQLNTAISSTFLTSKLSDTTYKLQVILVEDSIIDWQLDKLVTPNNDSTFLHRNMLRDAINGTWGDSITSGTITVNETVTHNYTYTINPSAFVPAINVAHCYVLAFIYNAKTYAVLQAEMKKVE